MPPTPRLTRRAFLRLAAGLAGAPFLQACARLAQPPPATTATQPSTPLPSKSPTAALTSSTPTNPSATPTLAPGPAQAGDMARLALVKTGDRAEGVRRALALLGDQPALQGRRILLKPNFNSADPAPGSTHPDILRALVQGLWERGAAAITLADRSGMGDTRRVMEQLGAFEMAGELGFQALVLDELGEEDWVPVQPEGSHWQRGFCLPRPLLEAEAVVQTCCLKTHRFGGHFTLSLKNSVGLAAKAVPGDSYNYMNELHGSPHQRRMIAEINAAYAPALVVMDGVEAFVDGGPDVGRRVSSEVVLAGSDRVALDAVGVAILRYFGTTPQVSRGPVFQQEQIARAVELGLGVDGPQKIELLTDDQASAAYAREILEVLRTG